VSVHEPAEYFAARRIRRREARHARRRRINAQVDVSIGVLIALVVLLAAPGLAIAALLAGVALVACAASLAPGRLRRRRDQ
jgi:hypothetical protein